MLGRKLWTRDTNFRNKNFLDAPKVSPVIFVKEDGMKPSLGLHVTLQDGARFSAACFVIILLQLEERQTRSRAPNSQQTVITIVPEGGTGDSCCS